MLDNSSNQPSQNGVIFYSIAGEGRGHATRAQTVVDHLCSQGHQVHIFAGGQAFKLLSPIYQLSSCVQIDEIPYLGWQYRGLKVSFYRTAANIIPFAINSPKWLRYLTQAIESEKPNLIISDFECLLPRAAKRKNIPVISLDHQHFILASDFSDLPLYLRIYAKMMTVPVYYTCFNKTHAIISSFFQPKLKPGYLQNQTATPVATLIRPAVEQLKVTPQPNRGHLICYMRKFLLPNVKKALLHCGKTVHIYGLDIPEKTEHNLVYKKIDLNGFIKDLSQCHALVTTAGNQLLGEALFLNKPVLALPEEGNHEQMINGFYLNKLKIGKAYAINTFSSEHLTDFLQKAEHYRKNINPKDFFGNDQVFSTLNRFIQHSLPKQPSSSNRTLPTRNDKEASCKEPYPIATH